MARSSIRWGPPSREDVRKQVYDAVGGQRRKLLVSELQPWQLNGPPSRKLLLVEPHPHLKNLLVRQQGFPVCNSRHRDLGKQPYLKPQPNCDRISNNRKLTLFKNQKNNDEQLMKLEKFSVDEHMIGHMVVNCEILYQDRRVLETILIPVLVVLVVLVR